MNAFEKLGISGNLSNQLTQIGFLEPTPIQQKAIPLLLGNDPTDFIGLAQTGTGKTAAFGLPLIELIDQEHNAIQALIMAPTRELVQQTKKQFELFGINKVVDVYGGSNIDVQIKALRKGAHIVVATPGRLLDLIRRRAIRLREVNYVILDEADEMLNMGFKEDIDLILESTPDDRVTWLFSATMPKEIRKIVHKYMTEPKEVSINAGEKSNTDISHKFVMTTGANKIPALQRFIELEPEMRGILFCRTKRETQEIADQMTEMGYAVEALNGDMSQMQRDAAMKRFKTRGLQLLIATDVAARGIDVSDLSHIWHHKVPDQLESYTHRSGRTGRAGKKGTSILMINPREQHKVRMLENKLKIQFEQLYVPQIQELKNSRIAHWANLIINTKVDKQANDILKEVEPRFHKLSKEDILKRLITTQLDHILMQNESEDLNEIHKKEDRRGSSSSNDPRFFINIGVIDGLTESDLVHLIADISNIDRKNISDVSFQKNCAYFNVRKEEANGFAEKFQGVTVDDRAIRVNRDDRRGGPSRSSKSSKPFKSFKGKKGKGKSFPGKPGRGGKKPHRGRS